MRAAARRRFPSTPFQLLSRYPLAPGHKTCPPALRRHYTPARWRRGQLHLLPFVSYGMALTPLHSVTTLRISTALAGIYPLSILVLFAVAYIVSALLIYDSCINFDKEVDIIWRRRPTTLSSLYIILRYVSVVHLLLGFAPTQQSEAVSCNSIMIAQGN